MAERARPDAAPPSTAVPLPPERAARALRAAGRLAPAIVAASERAEALGEIAPVVVFAHAGAAGAAPAASGADAAGPEREPRA